MKFTVAAIALLASATVASAMDLPVPGLALNTEVVAEYKVDASTTTLVATPELAYEVYGVGLTASVDLAVYDNAGGFTLADEFKTLPTLDFGASYLVNDNLELEALTSYDFDAKERGEVTVRATFNF